MPTNDHLVQSDTAIRSDVASIFVSLELSRSRWLVTSLSPGSEKMSKPRSPAVTELGCSIF
jgi:transposase